MSEPRINYPILLVDDDPRFHQDFRMIFAKHYEVDGAINEEKMWEKLKTKKYDLLVLDLMLDGKNTETGLKLILPLRNKYKDIPILVVTADDKIRTAVAALKRGAKNFLPKNDEDYEYWDQQFQETIRNHTAQENIKQLKEEVRRLKQGDVGDRYPFVGEAPRIREIKLLLELLSKKPDITVLLTGETGVGKEVAARYLHSCGVRRDKPFISVNLSAIPKTLLESTLFGSVKGAFTDAKADVDGYFKQANGGILMLDEIGDIDHEIQVKLLRFLEQRTIRPVGSNKDIELNVQIIAATNRNLDVEVSKGTFREDLRFRMNVIIEIPPLRERKEDIIRILDHYLEKKYDLELAKIVEPEVIQRIRGFHWPGNVRQLSNVIDGMLLWRDLYEKDKVDMVSFEEGLKNATSQSGVPTSSSADRDTPIKNTATMPVLKSRKEEQAFNDLTKIEETLRETRNRKAETADLLGYKGGDHLRARIVTCYLNFEHLFEYFPSISQQYASALELTRERSKK